MQCSAYPVVSNPILWKVVCSNLLRPSFGPNLVRRKTWSIIVFKHYMHVEYSDIFLFPEASIHYFFMKINVNIASTYTALDRERGMGGGRDKHLKINLKIRVWELEEAHAQRLVTWSCQTMVWYYIWSDSLYLINIPTFVMCILPYDSTLSPSFWLLNSGLITMFAVDYFHIINISSPPDNFSLCQSKHYLNLPGSFSLSWFFVKFDTI